MTAEAGRDWRIEEEEAVLDSLDDDSDLSMGERVRDLDARLAAIDRGDEEDEDEESEDDEDDETGVGLALGFADDYAADRASADAERAEFRALVETNMPGYQSPPEPLSRIEEAAVAAASLEPGSAEFEAFKARLAAANAELQRKARAGTEGFDSDGDPQEPPFNPASLDSSAFNEFMRAVASGGASADPRHIPAGESYESWSQKVNSALGRS